MILDLKVHTDEILARYDPTAPDITAAALKTLWLLFEPKSMAGIKAEQRSQQETVGIPVPVLRTLGKEVARAARQRVDDFLPLARLLWERYGREGRVVAVYPLGAMELIEPVKMLPILMELCRTCITWEDADQLAMYAVEPIVRKQPETWLSAMEPWLVDGNKWVRRAGVTVAGRLPMKRPEYTTRCLMLAERLLYDAEVDVKRAVSFALRLAARGDPAEVHQFLASHVPPENDSATWVLCDAIRSMANKLLPEFKPLLDAYESWVGDPSLNAKDRRSIESAIKKLRSI